jgi:hypothetical protein
MDIEGMPADYDNGSPVGVVTAAGPSMEAAFWVGFGFMVVYALVMALKE